MNLAYKVFGVVGWLMGTYVMVYAIRCMRKYLHS
jgi:hypothetical protein